MTPKTFTAAALIAVTSLTALPAAAQGLFSFTFNASNSEEAQAVQTGLTLYRIARGVESGAFVHQNGRVNAAAIAQVAGGGSTGIIHQDGNGHTATLDQRGVGQTHGIFQFGNGARSHVVQSSNGAAGLTFQFGFD